jgi:hypothetical protein
MVMAASGRPTVVTAEPVRLIVCPAHSSVKFRCRHSGIRRGGGGCVLARSMTSWDISRSLRTT